MQHRPMARTKQTARKLDEPPRAPTLSPAQAALRGADAGIAKKEHDRIQQSLERTKAVGKEQTDLLEDIAELRREIKQKQDTDE